jgi:iron complex outermembrane receptor protein
LGGSGYCQSVGERLRGLKKTVLYKGEGWVKTFKAIHCMQPATRRNDFDFAVSSTATGCSILLLAVGSAAHAADAPASVTAADDAELQEVVVTGIRAAIESAISAKKNAESIVETLSAEDIGKLPDTTIAESLARLPGVTTQRDRNGNATNVSIRGLGPDFNGYLLNGREQTSTGDSRAVDLSVYPAELIAGATVYKTGDASLMTAGLAGTIDNRLVDPLAYHGLVVAGNFEEIKNGQGLPVTGKGKRYSLSFIDQFADRKLGIAIGFVHSDSHSNSLASGSWGSTVPVTSTTGAALGNFNVPFAGGITYESDLLTDKRNGGAVILDFKPNESFSSEIDYYYARIKTGTLKIEAQRASNGAPITNATVSGGVVQSGTFAMTPYDLIDRNENLFDDDTIQSAGWKNSLKFSDTWSASVDLNHNSAKRVERDIEAYAGIATSDTLSFTNGGALVPNFTLGSPLSYTNPALITVHNVAGWSGVNYPPGSPYAGMAVPQAGYDKGPTITDKLDGIRLDFTHDLGQTGMFSGVQFGANYTKRTKDRVTDEGLIISAANGGYDPITFPSGAFVENNVGGTGLNLLAFAPQVNLWPGAVVLRKFNDDILSKTWNVEEKVATGYAKLNINTHWASIPVRGDVGVQVVNTNQSSAGFRADVNSTPSLTNPAPGLTTDGIKYTDVLPSLNLTGDLGSGNLLRTGAGIEIARPNMTDMRNSLAASTDTNSGNSTFGSIVGSAGNPRLKPFKADAFDLSYEKYFQTKAYLSAALFYKKLDTYITPATNYGTYDFSKIAPILGLAIPPSGPLGTFTETVNGRGGNLRGIELAASVPFSLLTSWLEGFGIMASYSSTESSVKLPNLIGLNPSQQVPTSGGTITLPGLSHINEKVVFYYERAGFSAFVADNNRSKYIGSVANTTVGGYPTLIEIARQEWVSAQAGYEVQSGPVKGLGIRFEGNNINKPIYKEYKSDGTLNATNQTGATYALKFFYKFQH